MTEDSQLINIRPTTAVYKTFERYNYTQSTAYAEFIDNSTQSYFNHRVELEQDENFDYCLVDIHHDSVKNIIVITDNCFGMERKDFERAIILNSAPDVTTGRNEFGMGLKAAASWFGRKWTVISTMMGSTNEYTATVNTEELARTKDATIPLKTRQASLESHYTRIIIENVIHDCPQKRSMGKLRQDIGGIYRRDIEKKNIILRYNDESLSYSAPKILEVADKDGSVKIWKKDLDYTIPYRGEVYTVKGFVAIREKASTEYAGLTLFRRDRVIIGGFSGTYRPKEIFGQSNSYAYQRLFGEINLDNWPVSQAKDKFTWEEELEDLFKQSINDRIGDLKTQAQNYRVREKEKKSVPLVNSQPPSGVPNVESYFNKVPSNQPTQPVSVPLSAMQQNTLDAPLEEKPVVNTSVEVVSPTTSSLVNENNTKNYEVKIGLQEAYLFQVTFRSIPGSTIIFTKNYDKVSSSFDIIINTDHPIVIRAKASSESMGTLTEMVIFLALSEVKLSDDNLVGRINPDSIRLQLNEISFNQIKEVKS